MFYKNNTIQYDGVFQWHRTTTVRWCDGIGRRSVATRSVS